MNPPRGSAVTSETPADMLLRHDVTLSRHSREFAQVHGALARLERIARKNSAAIAELRIDVAEIKSDVATLKSDVAELKLGMARVEDALTELLRRTKP